MTYTDAINRLASLRFLLSREGMDDERFVNVVQEWSAEIETLEELVGKDAVVNKNQAHQAMRAGTNIDHHPDGWWPRAETRITSAGTIYDHGARAATRIRRLGVLMAHTESDPEFKNYLDAFRQGLQKLGWIEGRNIQIDTRWGALDDAELRQRSAMELIALKPNLIVTQNTPPTASNAATNAYYPHYFCDRC
jgi:hypothetical protein